MNKQGLIQAYGDCKRPETSKCPIATSYEATSLPNFFVFDCIDEEPVNIVTDKECDYQLIVKNENKEEICLVKTDKCLFTDDHKKCDCILFSKNKCFFVEIKTGRKKGALRQKAVKQLATTIQLLKDSNIDLSEHEVKAVICFKSGQTHPTQPSLNSQRAVFLEKYKISLEEGNKIEF